MYDEAGRVSEDCSTTPSGEAPAVAHLGAHSGRHDSLTGLLLAAQALLTIAALGLTVWQRMRSAVCDLQCDFATADAALLALKVGVITIFTVTTVALALTRKRRRRTWPIPLAGIALTVATMVITNQIFTAALPSS